jgi:hypothetical protein
MSLGYGLGSGISESEGPCILNLSVMPMGSAEKMLFSEFEFSLLDSSGFAISYVSFIK